MADIEYIVPGSGIINDTEEDSEVIIPGVGIYNEQEAAAVGAIMNQFQSVNLGADLFNGTLL